MSKVHSLGFLVILAPMVALGQSPKVTDRITHNASSLEGNVANQSSILVLIAVVVAILLFVISPTAF